MDNLPGASPYTPSYNSAARAHGVLMFFSFGVLLPLSTLGARYLRRGPRDGPAPWWFPLHLLLNALALLFFIAGFTIAIFISGGSQFNSAHKQLGLTIACLLIIQPLGGLLLSYLHTTRPGMKRNLPWLDWPHWVLGWTIVVLGLANIPLGLYLATGTLGDYQTSTTIHVLYFVWMGFLVMSFVACEVLYRVKGGNEVWKDPINKSERMRMESVQ